MQQQGMMQQPGYGAAPVPVPVGGMPGQMVPTANKPWMPVAMPPSVENEWHVGLCGSCCESPGSYIASCILTPCYVYSQRERILAGNWGDYVCFNGVCCGDKVPCQSECPQCCMCIEACCCINCAIHGNRDYLLRKYYLKDSCLEKCFLHCCAGSNTVRCDCNCKGCADCLGGCLKDVVPCADCVNCGDCGCCQDCKKCAPEKCSIMLPVDCVSACFVTQQNIEMEYRGYPNDVPAGVKGGAISM